MTFANQPDHMSIVENLRNIAAILHQDAQHDLPPDSAADRAAMIANELAVADLLSGQDDQNTAIDPYAALKQRFDMLGRLTGAHEILGAIGIAAGEVMDGPDWSRLLGDQAKARKALLDRPEMAVWLDAAEARQGALPAKDRRNLALMRREWILAAGLPGNLLAEKARLFVDGELYHQDSRKRGPWTQADIDFIDHNFAVARQLGATKMAAMPGAFASVYDALLDDDMPGIDGVALTREFDKLAKILPGMIDEAIARQSALPPPLSLPEPTEAQLETLVRRVADMILLDPRRGRIVFGKAHPMSANTINEGWAFVRPSVRKFTDTIGEAVHELSHTKYDLGRPGYQPVDAYLGMGVHESMSLLGEAHACASPAFYRWLSVQAQEVLDLPGDPRLSAENLQRVTEQAERSPIRIYADELTYPLHIVNVRAPIGRALLDGSLTAAGFDVAWNERMETGLGFRPKNASEGSKQDVHWFCLLIPYFESYVVGRAGAAQLYAAATRQRPEIEAEIEQGNYRPLDDWLAANIYQRASQLTFDDLMIAATGEKLNFDHYLDHLSRRYLGRSYAAQPEAKPGKALTGSLLP